MAPFSWDGKALHRYELLDGRPGKLTITHSRRMLRVEGAADSAELRTKLRRMFQLGLELEEFHARTRSSPAHAWVEPAGFGRLLCGATLFEDAVKIILTTNTMWRQTVRMNELLVAKCGCGGAFPTPVEVAAFDADILQQDCRLGYRAKSIAALARGIAHGTIDGGTIDLAALADPGQTTEELFRSYRTLPGIGPYGAAHLLAMDGRHDFIAVDTEFRRFVRERYHGGRKVADATMLRRYAKWGRWKYLAYWSELWGER
jgi:3-methyladenine DNA glycosylase/8-oxoguanine DNA glycosylase